MSTFQHCTLGEVEVENVFDTAVHSSVYMIMTETEWPSTR